MLVSFAGCWGRFLGLQHCLTAYKAPTDQWSHPKGPFRHRALQAPVSHLFLPKVVHEQNVWNRYEVSSKVDNVDMEFPGHPEQFQLSQEVVWNWIIPKGKFANHL